MICIKEKALCSGCHACMNICPKNCIHMESDEEGFWYPKVEMDMCVHCDLCTKVCPIIQQYKKEKEETVAYAAFNKNEEIRYKSSSGGIFSLLATKILEKGGVVFGAAFTTEQQVHHIAIESIEDLPKLRGSKYLQSKIGDSYKLVRDYLNKGKWVYFSGTPCQIDGLISFLQKPYDKLICQDIICHGVPSPKVFKWYLREKNEQYGQKVMLVSFRSKVHSWLNYAMKLDFPDRSYVASHKNDLYMKAFLNDLILRPSCYQCYSKGIERHSDVTLADFWGIQKVLPELNDKQGISLVILHSDKGKELWHEIENDIYFEKVNVAEAIKYNPSMCTSAHKPNKRDTFMSNLGEGSFESYAKKYISEKWTYKVLQKGKRVVRRLKR